MLVILHKTGQNLTLEFSGTTAELLAHIGERPEVVLVVRDGTLITPDDTVTGAERIEIIPVVSGG